MNKLKKILALAAFGMSLLTVTAQVDKSIRPISESISETFLSPLKEITLPGFSMEELNQMEKTDVKKGEMPKFSRSIFTDINLDNAGSWTQLPNGDRLWRVRVISLGAQGLLPYFNKFHLPIGAYLHVYTPDKSTVIGAFTWENNPEDGYYATGLIHGESAIFEYYEPAEQKGKGIISLNEIGHAYRWVQNFFPKQGSRNDTLGFGQSDICEVNVNCSEGAAWQNQKRSVVCIVVQSSLGQGVCSGTLLNTTRQDCIPYLLSAQHCSEGVSSTHFSQFLFYFNYESPNCNSPFSIGTMGDYFVTGCTKKSDSNDNGGETGSDFLLLELSNKPPTDFNVYYSGWNNLNVVSDSGICIHHPQADIKKISTYTSPLVSTTWDIPSTVQDTHWDVRWSATLHGQGVTEEGSSGSALFNKYGQVIGTLTGGYSFCSIPDSADQFGKFSYHWASNGSVPIRQLKPWLDPDNSGISSINGRNADCVVGLSDTIEEEILLQVSPNPSSGLFNFNFMDEAEKTVSVFDAIGKVVFERKVFEREFILDLSSQSNGIYILLVENKSGRSLKKIVLNRD